MLLAEDQGESLLYTGDFKLGESATAEQAELPQADILVIESTYGDPGYRLPPREEALGQLFEQVRHALGADAAPIIEAYALGKAQEITRLLTAQGIPVLQHPRVYEISRIYESFGVDFGRSGLYAGRLEPGSAVFVPPRTPPLEGISREVRFAVTGWAMGRGAKYRLRVDHAIPLSDHADYDGLFEAVGRVAPRVVYCTHGPQSFVDRLCEAGFDARPLGPLSRKRLS